jgi:hypothetical protein
MIAAQLFLRRRKRASIKPSGSNGLHHHSNSASLAIGSDLRQPVIAQVRRIAQPSKQLPHSIAYQPIECGSVYQRSLTNSLL